MAGWLGRAVLTCALLTFALVTFLALPIAPASAQKRGGTVTYASGGGIGSLDPHVAGSLVELEVIHHVFETLVAMDESYNARPMLAAAVQIGDQARRCRFTLRRGVRFHNGEVVTSAAVLASFERYAKTSTNVTLLEDVARYDIPDADTFVVQLKTSNAMFVEMLKSPTYPLAILPPDQKDRPGREIEPIGTLITHIVAQ